MLEELVPLEPVHFFALTWECPYAKGVKLDKRHCLPSLTSFYGERPFAHVSLGWHEKGLIASVDVEGSFNQPDFPNFMNNDSIEFFIDTRNVKTSGYNTRFCHHFYFLPEAVSSNGDAIQAGEATRFRTDDAHELCDANLLKVKKKGKSIEIFIPAECLVGYDPSQFDRLGFTYRINRISGATQCFSASSEDFSIEQQPSLWASVRLVKKEMK